MLLPQSPLFPLINGVYYFKKHVLHTKQMAKDAKQIKINPAYSSRQGNFNKRAKKMIRCGLANQ